MNSTTIFTLREQNFFLLVNLIALSPDGADYFGVCGVVLHLFAQVEYVHHDGVGGGGEEFLAPHVLVKLAHRYGGALSLEQVIQYAHFQIRELDGLSVFHNGAVAAVNIAKFEMESGEIAKKGASISKAIDIITNGLRGSLDMNEGGELAERLAALYEYMAQRLLFANLKNSTAALDEVLELLNSLRSAWEQINPDQQAAA